MKNLQATLLSQADMSADQTSKVAGLDFMAVAFVLATFTGATIGGSLKLQISDTHEEVWNDLPGSEVVIAAAGSQPYDIAYLGFPRMRLVFTSTEPMSDGLLTVTISAKEL